jgi:FkbM family methyltransferase
MTRNDVLQAAAEGAFPTLRREGLGVLDVGARGEAAQPFREVASLVDVVGVEPDREECDRLRSDGTIAGFRSTTFLPIGLGSVPGRQTLHLCRSRGNSSCYRPNLSFLRRFPDPGRFEVEAEVPVGVAALDDIAREGTAPLPRIDFVKIDTQGFELDVLRGARATIAGQVVGVEIEVEFAPLYEGQPLFRDVDAFLAECGLTLFKLRRQEWVRRGFEHDAQGTAGQLVFGDALYLRDPLNQLTSWVPKDAHQAEALLLVASLYDLHDFVGELTGVDTIRGLIDAEAVRRYVEFRSQRLAGGAGAGARLWDVLRFVRASLGGGLDDFLHWAALRRPASYSRRWPRGDSDFYSRVK